MFLLKKDCFILLKLFNVGLKLLNLLAFKKVSDITRVVIASLRVWRQSRR